MSDTLDDDLDARREEAADAAPARTPWSGENVQDQPGGIPVATYGNYGADEDGAAGGAAPGPGPGPGAGRAAPRDIAPALRAAGIPERRIKNIERQIRVGEAIRNATHPPKIKEPPWDPSSTKQAEGSPSVSLGAEEPEAEHTWYGDYAHEMWSRAKGMGASLAGAAEGVAQSVSASPELQTWLHDTRTSWEESAKAEIEKMSPERQKAYASSFIQKGAPSPTGDIPGYLASSAVSMVPDALLMVAGKIPFTAPIVMGIFGGMSAGQAYTDLSKKIGEAKESDLLNSDFYRELRSQGASDQDARKQLIGHIAPILMGVQFSIGAAGSVLPIQAIKGQVGGAVARGALGRFGLGALEAGSGGAAAGAASSTAQQVANIQAGTQKDLDQGDVLRTAAGWGVPGAVFGGVGHAVAGERPAAAPKVREPIVDPAIKAAAEEQIGGKPEETPPPPPSGAELAPPPIAGGGLPTAGSALPGTGTPPTAGAEAAPPLPPGGGPPPTAGAEAAPPPGAGPPPGGGAGITPPGTPRPPVVGTPPTTVGATPPPAPPAPTAEAAAPPKAPEVPATGALKPVEAMSKAELAAELGYTTNKARKISLPKLRETVAAARSKPSAAPEVTVAQPTAEAPAAPAAPPETKPAPAAESAATAEPTADTTGLAGMGSGMASGMGESLRAALWEKVQAGETTEAGGKSNLLAVAKVARDAGGLQTREQFDAFAEKVAPLLSDRSPGWQERLVAAAREHVPVEPTTGSQPGKLASQQESPTETVAAHTAEAEAPAPPAPEMTKVAGVTDKAEVVKAEPKAEAKPPEAKVAAAPAEPAKPATVGEDLRAKAAAKRAAQKARMAETGPRQKAEGAAVAEEAAAPQEAAPAVDHAAVAREHMGKAGRAEGLKPAHIEALQNGLDRALKGAETEQEVLERMGQWGEKGTLPVPGTKITRAHVVDKAMQLMGHKRGLASREAARQKVADRREVLAEARTDDRPSKAGGDVEDKLAETGGRYDESEARQEVAREQTSDERAHELSDVLHETGDTEPSEGVAGYAGGKGYAETRDLAKKGNRLVNEVIAGEKTVHEASDAFGEKKAEGRPRRWKDLEHFIRDRKTLAESTEHFDKLVELSNERTELRRQEGKRDETKGDTAKRKSRLAEIEKEMNRLVKAGDPNLVEHLDRMLEDLKQGPPPEAHLSKARERPEGAAEGEEAGNKIARDVRDHALNERIRQHIAEVEGLGEGRYARLHDLLDRIIKAKDLPAHLEHYRELAKILRKKSPDIPVMSREEHELTHLSNWKMPSDAAGAMVLGKNNNVSHIVLDHAKLAVRSAAGHFETLLHEGAHTLTSAYIRDLKPGDRDYKVLSEIYRELGRLNKEAPQEVHGFVGRIDPGAANYALHNLQELHTMLMTSPSLHAWARAQAPSAKFTQAMARLGYPVGKGPGAVWRSFVGVMKRALGIGKDSQLPSSFLEQVMKPLSDVAERGEKYSRQFPTREHEIVGAGDAGFARKATEHDAETGKFHEAYDRALNKLDPLRAGDKLRSAALQWSPLDSVVGWNKKLVEGALKRAHDAGRLLGIKSGPLEAFRDAQRSAGHDEKKFRDDNAERVDALLGRLGHKDSEPVAQLMHDVSMADAQLGPGAKNTHLKGDDLKRAEALQARFDKLSPSQKATYVELRDLRRDWYREERDARLHNLLSQFVPDLTQAQRDALVETMRSKKGIEETIKGESGSEAAKALGTAWEGNRRFVKMVAQVHRLGHISGDYFPLRRDGKYVVRYGDKGDKESYGVEMFERRGEAEARRAELAAQGHEVAQVMLRRETHLDDISPDSDLIRQFESRIQADKELSPHAADIRDELKNILLESATASEKARTAMRRERVAGARIDPKRDLAADYIRTGASIANARHGAQRRMALGDMKMLIKDASNYGKPGEAITMQQVVGELEKRVATIGDHNDFADKVGHVATQLSFAKTLLSPVHALYNTLDIQATAHSHLGARHGYAHAVGAVTRAMKQLGPGMTGKAITGSLSNLGKGLKAKDWNLSTYAQDRLVKSGADAGQMKTLFDAANHAGLLDHTETTDIKRMSKGVGGNLATKTWTRFQQMITFGVHAVDEMNKAAVLKSAFDLEMKKNGGNVEGATKYAVEALSKSTPNRAVYGKARIATRQGSLGALAPMAMQFRQYGLWMYGMMAVEARNMIHAGTKAERREAMKAFAGVLFTHGLMAGALGTAGVAEALRYGGGLYDWVTGAERPHDYANNVRAFLSDTFGPRIGEMIAHGLPTAAGMDIHRNIGTGDMLNVPSIDSFKSSAFAKAFASAVFGASGDNFVTALGGVGQLFQGNVGAALKTVAPRPLVDAGQAYKFATAGVTDSKGKTILPADKLSPLDIAYKAVGLNPSRVSEVRASRNAILEAKQEAQHARTTAIQSWLSDMDKQHAADATQAVRKYNDTHPSNKITVGQLLQARKAAKDAEKHPERLGLNLPKKGARAMVEAGRFGNF
jgi:hypothetical protein